MQGRELAVAHSICSFVDSDATVASGDSPHVAPGQLLGNCFTVPSAGRSGSAERSLVVPILTYGSSGASVRQNGRTVLVEVRGAGRVLGASHTVGARVEQWIPAPVATQASNDTNWVPVDPSRITWLGDGSFNVKIDLGALPLGGTMLRAALVQ